MKREFNFLPKPEGYSESMASDAVDLAFPFAFYRGFKPERFSEIWRGSEPDDEEKEVIKWLCEIGIQLLNAFSQKDFILSDVFMNKAREIASLYLDENTIDKAVYVTILRFEQDIDPSLVTPEDLSYLPLLVRENSRDSLN